MNSSRNSVEVLERRANIEGDASGRHIEGSIQAPISMGSLSTTGYETSTRDHRRGTPS